MTLSEKDLTNIESLLNRPPSEVEKVIFDTMWSEHCSYKSSKDVLKKYLPTTGSEVVLGIGEDAGLIHFTEHEGKRYSIAVSHESHNHPSQILPVEGAATGVGGVVRDVYCMGADVIGVLNSLHFGIDSTGDSPMVDEIAERVVIGVSDYANPLGVPVLGGETLYHSSYNDNCLVNVAAVGLIEESKLIRSFVPDRAKSEPYDVILIGKSTDATGYGGASFSSATLDQEDEVTNMGAVQVHDPFLKRVLVEAIKVFFKTVADEGVEVGFKDLGAGGISCVTSEMAAHGGFGVVVHLDKVNLAIADLAPEIIACSETQERFAMAVPRSFSEKVLSIFNDQFEMGQLYPGAGAVVIGEITEEKEYVLKHFDTEVCRLPIDAITTEVKDPKTAASREIDRVNATPANLSKEQLTKVLNESLELLNNCSKRYIYRYFDNAVRGQTVVYPGEADAVVVAPIEGSTAGVVTSMDSNLYGELDPYVSGAYAVAEAVRNVISVGGRPIAVTDCLNYGNPEVPSVFFDFDEGVKGIAEACNALGFIDNESLPVISGNVSFYNESSTGTAVVPSPVVMVVGKMPDYRQALTMQVTQPDCRLFLLGKRYSEFGATQLGNLVPGLNNVAPQCRLDDEHAVNKVVYDLIQKNNVEACHDISVGGAYMSLCEMLLGERGLVQVGAKISIPDTESVETLLFSENGGYILAIDLENLESVQKQLEASGIWYLDIGQTVSGSEFSIGYGNGSGSQVVFDTSLHELTQRWLTKVT